MAYTPKKASEVTGNKRFILIEGAPKHGKTVAAATISNKCPTTLPTKIPVYLDDIYIIQFDPDGMQSLLSLGLDAPAKDLSSCTTLDQLNAGFNAAIAEAKEGIKEGSVRAVIIDPLSTLDINTQMALKPMYDGEKDTGRFFGKVTEVQLRYIHALRGLGCHVVATTHIKAAGNPFGDQAQLAAVKQATNIPGVATVVAELTGRSGSQWKKACTQILGVACEKKGAESRFYFITRGKGYEAGGRFIGLDDEEPANLRLLLDKAERNAVIKSSAVLVDKKETT